LEVCQVFHFWILTSEECFPFFQLLGDASLRGAVFWIEGLVVAVGATASPDFSIPIGAGETGMHGDFLHLKVEEFLQKLREIGV
jgi:hypothetical protein